MHPFLSLTHNPLLGEIALGSTGTFLVLIGYFSALISTKCLHTVITILVQDRVRVLSWLKAKTHQSQSWKKNPDCRVCCEPKGDRYVIQIFQSWINAKLMQKVKLSCRTCISEHDTKSKVLC